VERMKAAATTPSGPATIPPSPAFLDACDRMGILGRVIEGPLTTGEVQEEIPRTTPFLQRTWWEGTSPPWSFGRNHPSVILWSIGQ